MPSVVLIGKACMLQGELQGADQDHGAHGGNPHPNPAGGNQAVPDAAPAANAEVDMAEPQNLHADGGDIMNLDLSGSTMRFFRGSGSDLSIDVSVDFEDNMLSDEVSSRALEEIFKLKAANHAIPSGFSLNTPPGFTLEGIFVGNASSSMCTQQSTPMHIKPFIIDLTKLSDQSNEPLLTGMELVPWKPTADANALKLFAAFIEHQEALHSLAAVNMQQEIQDPSQNSGVISSPVSESEKDATPSSPPARSISFETPKTKRGSVALPTTISSTSTPLVATATRRSQRQKGSNYTHAWLDRTPTKKQKITVLQIDKETGMVGPVKIITLRSWGVDCGVDPSDLSDEVLMQTPSENHE